jgi:predicted ATPase
MSVANWLRVDLHAHTPFDETRNWGRSARSERDKSLSSSPQQARAWLDRCVEAGIDIVAITDHNTLAGYDEVREVLGAWRSETGSGLLVLPGVELHVDGCHFLVVGEPNERDWLDGLIGEAFGTRPRIKADHEPNVAKMNIHGLAQGIQEATLAGRSVVALPAHVDTGGLVDVLKKTVREYAFAHRAWSGFQVKREAFNNSKTLLRLWAAAWLFSRLPDDLDDEQSRELQAFVKRNQWPLIHASDPERLADLGSVFTWMKMSVPGVEGVRQALLDPESRLRRHGDEPPTPPACWIERIEIDEVYSEDVPLFGGSISVVFSPALNAIIGGRGTGKSTILELLRWGLDRSRPGDFSEHEDGIRRQVIRVLSSDDGILRPSSRVRIVVQRDGSPVEVVRTMSELRAAPMGGEGDWDVRKLIEPRILSQRQISDIAKDHRAILREVDKAIWGELEDWREQHVAQLRALEQLQVQRRDLSTRLGQRAAVETDIELLDRKIGKLEEVAKSGTLNAHRDVQRQARWLSDVVDDLDSVAADLPAEPFLDGQWPSPHPTGPAGDVLSGLRAGLAQRRATIEKQRAEIVESVAEARRLVVEAQNGPFATIRQPLAEEYRKRIEQLREEGLELGEIEALYGKLAAARKKSENLQRIPARLEELRRELEASLTALDALHLDRLGLREDVAVGLEERDADIRIAVTRFGDRAELVQQRDRWWGGTGMRNDDWERLVAWVYETGGGTGEVPSRWRQLIQAFRADREKLQEQIGTAETVRALVSAYELSGYFERAVSQIDPELFDIMERFLPDDLVAARFRDRDVFRPITRGSMGQKNTAILSLLLTVGSGPLVLDQPEDDLDNRYIYDVVVDLLRATKTERQIITATHNANVPVNGDAETIVALDPALDGSTPMLAGTLESSDVKDAVSNIMEGSEAAFRLRRQRYGY